jgi:hypothetical protein
MYIRVVRFEDVSAERMEEASSRADERGGPPEGVPAKGIKVIHDADQQTAVVIQFFDSEEDMREGARVLEQMDSSETPGKRVSVDAGEVKFEREAS